MNRNDWFFRLVLPRWVEDNSPDGNHPHRRRFTRRYRKKKDIVKSIWIASGLLMILQSTPAMIMALALGTTFLSFVILDETP